VKLDSNVDTMCKELKKSFKLISKENIDKLNNNYPRFINGKVDISTGQFIEIFRKGYKDSGGTLKAIYIEIRGEKIGLIGDGINLYIELSNNISLYNDFRDKISIETIQELIFDWLKSNYLSESSNLLINYLKDKLNEIIEEIEIFVPIYSLKIQNEFRLGNVVFKKLTEEIINHWMNEYLKNEGIDKHFIQNYYCKFKSEMSGLSVACIKLNAERQKAIEIAYKETEIALVVLRIFSDASINPNIRSYLTILGKQELLSLKCLIVKNNKLITPNEQALCRPNNWLIKKEEFEKFQLQGFQILDDLIRLKNPNEFQQVLLKSINLYSLALLSKDIEYKLVLIFASLESIFIKNNTTPIQNNLSQAFALLLTNDVNKRKEIIKNVKKAYEIRSRFVHKGKENKDMEITKIFMENVKKIYIELIKNNSNFQNRDELINFLEDIKISASISLDNSHNISKEKK
jgi:hypothetical protein